MTARSLALILALTVGACFDEPGSDGSSGGDATSASTSAAATGSGSTSAAMGSTSVATGIVDDGTTDTGTATGPSDDSSTGTMPPDSGCTCPEDPEPVLCDDFEEFTKDEFKDWTSGSMGAAAAPPTHSDDGPRCGQWAMQSSVPVDALFSQLVHAEDVELTPASVFVAHTYFRVDDCAQVGQDMIPIRLAQLRLDAANFQYELQADLLISPDGDRFELAPVTNPMQEPPIVLGDVTPGWHELEVTVDNTGVQPNVSVALDGTAQPAIELDAFEPLHSASWILGLARNSAFTTPCTASYDLAWLTIAPM